MPFIYWHWKCQYWCLSVYWMDWWLFLSLSLSLPLSLSLLSCVSVYVTFRLPLFFIHFISVVRAPNTGSYSHSIFSVAMNININCRRRRPFSYWRSCCYSSSSSVSLLFRLITKTKRTEGKQSQENKNEYKFIRSEFYCYAEREREKTGEWKIYVVANDTLMRQFHSLR